VGQPLLPDPEAGVLSGGHSGEGYISTSCNEQVGDRDERGWGESQSESVTEGVVEEEDEEQEGVLLWGVRKRSVIDLHPSVRALSWTCFPTYPSLILDRVSMAPMDVSPVLGGSRPGGSG